MKIKILALALCAVLLVSCMYVVPPEDLDYHAVDAPIFRQSARSHLYANVPGISELRLTALARGDRFNLRFSHREHFYAETIYVEISTDLEDAVIYFTTNGADPVQGVQSRNNRRYSTPVRIAAGDFNEPTVLRARAFLCDEVYSDILTHTFFVSERISERFSEQVYVFSITSDPHNLFDYYHGILVPGALRSQWHRDNPGRWPDPPMPANFNIRGRESERPAYVEVLNSRGELLISQAVGIRVRGGWSRADDRAKSMAIYARAEYDPIFDKLYYDFFRFFDDVGSGRTMIRGTDIPVEAHRMLVLRNGGNDRHGAHVREELSQVLARQAYFLDYKGLAPAAKFLNGVYMGFFWLQNFYPDYYFFDHYGLTAGSNIDVREFWNGPQAPSSADDHEAFEEFARLVCLDNYMKYFAFQVFVQNRDWPHNNLKYWRFSGDGGELINRYYDGRFRMLLFDAEMGWGMYGQGFRDRRIRDILNSQYRTFGRLMRRPDMIEKFCNQMFDLLNTIFRPENVNIKLDRLIDLQEHELQFAMSRRASNTYRGRVDAERRIIRRFAENRAEHVIRDMRLTFGLEEEFFYVSVTGAPGASVRLNTLRLEGAGTLESNYFTAHSVPLVSSSPDFSHWIINGVRHDTPELMLSAEMAQGGQINAQVFLR